MSKAVKCDICGSFFDGLIGLATIKKTTRPNKMAIYFCTDSGVTRNDCCFDICPECYLAIKKALGERKALRISPYEDDLK